MIYQVTIKKKLHEKRLNAILEYHVAEPHALSHEVSAFIYIYIELNYTWEGLNLGYNM